MIKPKKEKLSKLENALKKNLKKRKVFQKKLKSKWRSPKAKDGLTERQNLIGASRFSLFNENSKPQGRVKKDGKS